MEQLNIEGKRSGEGFIAHKQGLVNALSRASADRLNLMGLTLGRKGFLNYLKALSGNNMVKVVPFTGNASESRVTGKCLKVVCGASSGYLTNNEWVGDKTAPNFCDLKVNPRYSVTPNLGALELAEALDRVLTFTSPESSRPVLQAVYFTAKHGKLELVSSDGYRLGVFTTDFSDEGEAIVHRDDLKGMTQALKRARRVKLGFETDDATKRNYLTIETELIRYRYSGLSGKYPEYLPLIPKDFKANVNLDTVETRKALSSLKALTDVKGYPVDLDIGDGKITITSTDDKGRTEVKAETSGKPIKIRLDGKYLTEALKACGGMAELHLAEASLPVLFQTEGFQLVVMPMMTGKAPVKVDDVPKPEAKPAPVEVQKPKTSVPKTDKETESAVAEAKAITEAKPSKAPAKAKQPVAV